MYKTLAPYRVSIIVSGVGQTAQVETIAFDSSIIIDIGTGWSWLIWFYKSYHIYKWFVTIIEFRPLIIRVFNIVLERTMLYNAIVLSLT